ncbi:MAG TPA: SBBP repeat-containing protein [Vicinamibacteria bacterium]|nr:SBBP repeat-containing protein [Vicinamibacteria bacterium]
MARNQLIPASSLFPAWGLIVVIGCAPRTEKAANAPNVRTEYGKLPLSFERNEGQVDESVKFVSRGSGYTLFLTATDFVLSLAKPPSDGTTIKADSAAEGRVPKNNDFVRMRFVGANPAPELWAFEELPGKSHYLIGNDPARWRTDIRTFGKVQYKRLYPGVDAIFYGHQGRLEYDVVVHPGADPDVVTLEFQGPDTAALDSAGDLVLRIGGADLRMTRPFVYQEEHGVRTRIHGEYTRKGSNAFGFQLGDHDRRQALIIDPVLEYSTYLGGSGLELGVGIDIDSFGNAYVTGATMSVDFPTVNPIGGGGVDAFVAKLDTTGSSLVYSTYLGGSDIDQGFDIAVDGSGNAYVTGESLSTDFPTANPIQNTPAGLGDAFVAKLDATGSSLVYSTYLGGADRDQGHGIAFDSSGSSYITGNTASTDFPTQNPFQPSNATGGTDAFVTKIDGQGNAFVYSTYLGGSSAEEPSSIAVDAHGSAYVTGSTSSSDFPTMNALQPTKSGGGDVFLTKFNSTGSVLVFSTYLGGTQTDSATGVTVDHLGNAYVAGTTESNDFPMMNPVQAVFNGGIFEGFLSQFNSAGSALIYSTYLGGSGLDIVHGIDVDSGGNCCATGRTQSTDFPTKDSVRGTYQGGTSDAFVTCIKNDGLAILYSTYLGGAGGDSGGEIAVDVSGAAYVVGDTDSADFPTLNAFQGVFAGGFGDAFVAKIGPPVRIVEIDIKPGSDPNCFNNDGHGVIPVAILSSTDFNATLVDPSTVLLDGQTVRVVGKKGTAQAHFENVNDDQLDDLVLQILDQDGTYAPGNSIAILTGETFDGTSIEGTDFICIAP